MIFQYQYQYIGILILILILIMVLDKYWYWYWYWSPAKYWYWYWSWSWFFGRENIDIDIDIEKKILKNIDIDIEQKFHIVPSLAGILSCQEAVKNKKANNYCTEFRFTVTKCTYVWRIFSRCLESARDCSPDSVGKVTKGHQRMRTRLHHQVQPSKGRRMQQLDLYGRRLSR